MKNIINHLRRRIGELEVPNSHKREIFRARSDKGELSVFTNFHSEEFVDLYFARDGGGSEILVGAVTDEHVDSFINKIVE